MIPTARIARHTLYLAASHIFSRLLGLTSTALLVRYLDPAEFGGFSLAIGYLALFSAVIESGLDAILIRQISQAPDQFGRIMGQGILLRGAFAVPTILIALTLIPALTSQSATAALYRTSLWLLFLSPLAVYRVIFLLTQKIRQVAVLDVIAPLVMAVLILFMVTHRIGGALTMIWLQVLSLGLANGLYYFFGRRAAPQAIQLGMDWPLFQQLLKPACPLLAANIANAIQLQAGRLAVGRLLGETEGGLYSIALSLPALVSFFPLVYFASAYPQLARLYHTHPHRFRQLYRLSFRVMLLVSLPVGILATLLGEEILTAFAGDFYLPAYPLFVLLSWSVPLQFSGVVFYYSFLSAGLQGLLPRVAALRSALYLGLLMVLIPTAGLVGAGAAALAMYGVAILLYAIIKATRQYVLDWLQLSWAPIAVTSLAAFLSRALKPYYPTVWIVGLALSLPLLWFLLSSTPAELWWRWRPSQGLTENEI